MEEGAAAEDASHATQGEKVDNRNLGPACLGNNHTEGTASAGAEIAAAPLAPNAMSPNSTKDILAIDAMPAAGLGVSIVVFWPISLSAIPVWPLRVLFFLSFFWAAHLLEVVLRIGPSYNCTG